MSFTGAWPTPANVGLPISNAQLQGLAADPTAKLILHTCCPDGDSTSYSTQIGADGYLAVFQIPASTALVLAQGRLCNEVNANLLCEAGLSRLWGFRDALELPEPGLVMALLCVAAIACIIRQVRAALHFTWSLDGRG